MELNVITDSDCANDVALIKSAVDSYMKKDDIIKILNNTDFYAVKNFSCDCITSFVVKKDDNGKTIVTTRGYDIRID